MPALHSDVQRAELTRLTSKLNVVGIGRVCRVRVLLNVILRKM